jgi:nitrogen-specific signal transduction histidine kinase
MIEQVLLNLIKNAIEAMQASDHRARTLVITSGRGAEGMLQVSLAR